MKKALLILAVAGFFAACGGANKTETPACESSNVETPASETPASETSSVETPVEEVPAE